MISILLSFNIFLSPLILFGRLHVDIHNDISVLPKDEIGQSKSQAKEKQKKVELLVTTPCCAFTSELR